MTERWEPIATAPDYAVSDIGRIKRVTASKGRYAGRILRPSLNTHGYPFVSLVSDGKKKSVCVHRIVCAAFHGERPSKAHEVAHGDGDKTNNAATNLRWATRKENFADRDRHGTTARGERHFSFSHPELVVRGERHANARLTAEIVAAVRRSPMSTSALSRRFGVAFSTMQAARSGKTWKHVVAVIDAPSVAAAA